MAKLKLSKKAKANFFTAKGQLRKHLKNDIDTLVYGTKIYPKQFIKNGRHFSLRDRSGEIIKALKLLGYKYKTGNDAPRGGKEGDYIKISKTAYEALIKLSKM